MIKVQISGMKLTDLTKKASDNSRRKIGRAAEILRGSIADAGLTPYRTGQLSRSAESKTTSHNSAEVSWNTNYALKLYFGIDFNFTKQTNPFARARWDEPITQNTPKMEKIMASAMQEGWNV